MTSPHECPRHDCPVRASEHARATWEALVPAVREAITRAWCVNDRILDGSLCAAAIEWYTANHARRGR